MRCGQIREGYDATSSKLDQNLDLVAAHLDGGQTLPGDELDPRIEDRILQVILREALLTNGSAVSVNAVFSCYMGN